MTGAAAAWLAYWGAKARYHRYQVHGLPNLPRDCPALIVGYHGRGSAADLCMLSTRIHQRDAYLPHAFWHQTMLGLPWVGEQISKVGGIGADGPEVRAALERNEHIMVTPGGAREAFRPAWQRHRVNWGPRCGYLRFARKYGLPIVAVGAAGTDDIFLGLTDGYRISKRLGIAGLPLWVAVGATGLWPLTLPLPSRVVQVIRPPIILDSADDSAMHGRVIQEVQAAIDEAVVRKKKGPVRARDSEQGRQDLGHGALAGGHFGLQNLDHPSQRTRA